MARPPGMTEEAFQLAERVVVWEADGPRIIRNVLKDRNGAPGRFVIAVGLSAQIAAAIVAEANAVMFPQSRQGNV